MDMPVYQQYGDALYMQPANPYGQQNQAASSSSYVQQVPRRAPVAVKKTHRAKPGADISYREMKEQLQ